MPARRPLETVPAPPRLLYFAAKTRRGRCGFCTHTHPRCRLQVHPGEPAHAYRGRTAIIRVLRYCQVRLLRRPSSFGSSRIGSTRLYPGPISVASCFIHWVVSSTAAPGYRFTLAVSIYKIAGSCEPGSFPFCASSPRLPYDWCRFVFRLQMRDIKELIIAAG